MPTPTPDQTDTQELFFPKEWTMDATISTTTRDLARKYLLEQFATVWEVDAQLLSEWLAENDSHYANLSDEEGVDTALEEFV